MLTPDFDFDFDFDDNLFNATIDYSDRLKSPSNQSTVAELVSIVDDKSKLARQKRREYLDNKKEKKIKLEDTRPLSFFSLQPEPDLTDKKIIRKIRNRESAARHRARKEHASKMLNDENKALKEKIKSLENENQRLRETNDYVLQLINEKIEANSDESVSIKHS